MRSNNTNILLVLSVPFLLFGTIVGNVIAGNSTEKDETVDSSAEKSSESSGTDVRLGPLSAQSDDYDLKAYTADGSGKLRFKTADGNFEMRFGGRIMWDVALTSADDNVENSIEGVTGDTTSVDSGSEFRRARLFTSGTLYDTVGYKFQVDFSDNPVEIEDAYIDFPSPIKNSSIKTGQFKEPFSLDELTSSKYIELMERALPTGFAPSRSLGAALSGSAAGDKLNYAVGGFRSSTTNGRFSRGEGNYAATGRLTFLPYTNEDRSQLVHVGAGASNRSVSGAGFDSRPEVHVVDDFVDTGTIGDAQGITLFGLEAATVWQSFSARAEWIQADVDSQSAGDPSYDSYYIQASYWLTGEHNVYDGGSFDRVKPERNFMGEDDGPGAWQIAARFSSMDLSDTNDGELDDVTVGINWHLNPATRIMLNYVRADVTNGVGGADGTADFVTTRFQIDF